VLPTFLLYLSLLILASGGYPQPKETEEPKTDKPAITMVAVGDSITAGFNSSAFGTNFDMSWSTGTSGKVISHYQRLSKVYDVKAVNRAKAGSHVLQTLEQIKEAVSEATRPIDYITMMVGSNDLCGWPLEDNGTYLDDYTKNLRESIGTAIEHNSDVKILISSLPNIERLYEVGKEIRYCRAVWGTGRVCPNILSPRAKNREIYFERWHLLNREISNIANDNHTNIIFTEEVSKYEFTREDVSRWDCFHPSVQGQKRISEALWLLGWFN